MRRIAGLALIIVVPLSCGARTDLPTDLADNADTFDAGVALDSAKNPVADARYDAPPGKACTSNAACDDGVACTDDVCDPTLGRCFNSPIDTRCGDGIFCDGEGFCDPTAGCKMRPRSCDDGLACTVDTCSESTRSCVNAPDDALCPISHGCDPPLGCQARALAQSATELYEVKLPSGALRDIGPISRRLGDIALEPNGTLYGVDTTTLSGLDSNTGALLVLANLNHDFNALDAAPDGTLFAGAIDGIYTLDLVTGAATSFAPFPNDLESSGDIAFLNGRLLVTARDSTAANDFLVEFDRTTRVATVLGSVGFRCIWGLAAFGPTLYGLTCEGLIITIDGTTGQGTQVATSAAMFYGATAR